MTELESRCLDAFPNWLTSLGDDARALAGIVEAQESDQRLRRAAVSSLNYLFRSLDLIPDGIEDLGYIDDAFVLRVAMAEAVAQNAALAEADPSGVVGRLSADAELISAFLEADYERLRAFVKSLDQIQARGRTVDDILADAEQVNAFAREVKSFADSYAAPTFAKDAKNLVKLRSFLAAKLPA